LLVSHDRYLIDALATQIWEIDEEKAILRTFNGSYSQYHQMLEAERIAMQETISITTPVKEAPRKPSVTAEQKRKKARLKEVEVLIDQLEADLASLSRRLENPPKDAARVQKLGNEYVRVQKELDALMEEWGELHE